MKSYIAAALVAALAVQFPAVAYAGRGGGFSRPAPSRPSGGFDLNRDVQRPQPQQPRPQQPQQRPQQPPQQRPQQPQQNNNANKNNNNNNRNNSNNNNNNRNNNNNNNNNRNNNNNNRNNNNNNNNNRNNNNNNNNRTNVNVNNNTVNRTVINNPVYVNNSAWGWNHGVVWAPAPYYWGGGFWGAMAIGVTSAAVGAAVYGSIVDSTTHVTYTSYQVQSGSPGATFLSNYQLTQTQCGPPNLVVVYGPSNSVICAYPNNLVAAGTYTLNTETLSITST